MLYHIFYVQHLNKSPHRAPMPISELAEPNRRAPNAAATITPTPTC